MDQRIATIKRVVKWTAFNYGNEHSSRHYKQRREAVIKLAEMNGVEKTAPISALVDLGMSADEIIARASLLMDD